jgi:glycosyltransferase involved in cell wall biosynthesis
VSALRLLLVTDAVGGVWVYSLELARALQPLGIETILALTGPSPGAAQRDAAADIPLIDTGLPLEWLDTEAAAMLRASEKLSEIAASERADIVQTSSAAQLAGGAFEQPCIAVQHSCLATWWAAVKRDPMPPDFKWRRDLVARGLRRADAVVAPTIAFADATRRTYGLDQPVVAVHNGRSTRAFGALPQGDFVLTAGRLWDVGKNAAVLDRAAARIDAAFQAAGATQGPNGARIEFDHLFTLGELSEALLGGLLSARPIFASAALYEPFGLSVLEAAQAGCALVLSDIPTHRELWGGAAILVDPRDDAAFAAAINQMLGDRLARQRLGARARERSQAYAPAEMAGKMAGIYERVTQPQLIAGAT